MRTPPIHHPSDRSERTLNFFAPQVVITLLSTRKRRGVVFALTQVRPFVTAILLAVIGGNSARRIPIASGAITLYECDFLFT
jgi:hypothetical protein